MTVYKGKRIWWPDRRLEGGGYNLALPGEEWDFLEESIRAERQRELMIQLRYMAKLRRERPKREPRSPGSEKLAALHLQKMRSLFD